jgi:hypothetical protein
MTKYRKKPVVVEAFRYGVDGGPDWFHDLVNSNDIITRKAVDSTDIWCEIKTLEGTMRADYGDYIIRGVHGEVYPCKPDIFAETYEKVDE